MAGYESSGLIDLIYDAAVEPALWVGVIAQMSEAVGGNSGWLSQLNFVDGSGGHLDDPTAGTDKSWVPSYLEHFGALNPFAIATDPRDYLARWTPRILTHDDELRKEDLVRTEFFNDWMRPQDVASTMMIRLARHGDETAVLNLNCSMKRWRFEQADIETAALYHPHLIRAFNLGRKLAWKRQRDSEATVLFDASAHALFIVDGDARIQRVNRAGEALLSAGSHVAAIAGKLTAAASAPTRRLHGIIAAAASGDATRRTGGSMALPTLSRLPLSIMVVPLGSERLGPFRSGPSVLVCITDLGAGASPPQQRLRDLFGLTPAEARLTLALLEGATPNEAAQRFGVSRNTVHVQLARIFEKTGTSRQAELVRLAIRTVGVEVEMPSDLRPWPRIERRDSRT